MLKIFPKYLNFENISKKFIRVPGTLDNRHSSYHPNENSILQLINGISNDLEKLLKYFNGTAIFTPFFMPLFPVLPIIFDLYLNDDELSTVKLTSPSISPLLKFHKLPEVSE